MNIDLLILGIASLILVLSIYQMLKDKFKYRSLTSMGNVFFGLVTIFVNPGFRDNYQGLFYFFLVAFIVMGILSIYIYINSPRHEK
ncbi:hypothetical protein [Paenibacillus arenosi]|uniref:Uncharacterized protein n=1 Tax=Paenibacillus arenosi TaxID=2774142 RepID=A0ABR9B437_9BACL|nr:hypothetical protein [Paenibacillus arenosi]MBD8501129.1 hypothetical protein [Paenibacillus arenosi]